MTLSIPQYLQERLSPAHYRALHEISDGFTRPLFAYDAESRRFECAEGFDPDALDDDAVDALCLACELLSDAGLSFDLASPLIESSQAPGVIRLTYDFSQEEEETYDRFRGLLHENTSPDAGFRTDFQKYPWGHRVVVDLEFQSDFDYQQKKDVIDLMLLVAKRRLKDNPFFGNRLS